MKIDYERKIISFVFFVRASDRFFPHPILRKTEETWFIYGGPFFCGTESPISPYGNRNFVLPAEKSYIAETGFSGLLLH